MDLRVDSEEERDNILATTMQSVRDVLSFCPQEILRNGKTACRIDDHLIAPARISFRRCEALMRAKLWKLLINLRKLEADSKKLEEYLVFKLGKKIVFGEKKEQQTSETPRESDMEMDIGRRESTPVESEDVPFIENPLSGENDGRGGTREAFWIPFSDNETEPLVEEQSQKKKSRGSRSLSLSCALIFLYILYVTVSYVVYSQRKLIRRLSSHHRSLEQRYSTFSNDDTTADITLPTNKSRDLR